MPVLPVVALSCPSSRWCLGRRRSHDLARVARWGCSPLARGNVAAAGLGGLHSAFATAKLTRASAAGRTEPRRRFRRGPADTRRRWCSPSRSVPVVVVVLLEDVPGVVVVPCCWLLRPGRAGRRRAPRWWWPSSSRWGAAGACGGRRRAGGTGRGGGRRGSQLVLALVDAAPLLPEAVGRGAAAARRTGCRRRRAAAVAGEVAAAVGLAGLEPGAAPLAGAGDLTGPGRSCCACRSSLARARLLDRGRSATSSEDERREQQSAAHESSLSKPAHLSGIVQRRASEGPHRQTRDVRRK